MANDGIFGNNPAVCPRCGKPRIKNPTVQVGPAYCHCPAAGEGPKRQNPLNLDDGKLKSVTDNWSRPNAGKANRRIKELPPGTIIGGIYQIIEVIGHGGMGVVYKVKHVSLQRVCALKILAPEFVDENSWKRFQIEARMISQLSHPCLVKVYDLSIHEHKLPFYTMDLIEGKNLETLIQKNGPLPLYPAINLFIELLDGFAYAHRNGIIHRDIKPANIIVNNLDSPKPTAKILDFGIAKLLGMEEDSQKLTATGDVFGSPFYMSPEQSMAEKIDTRADIYSIGCTMFEALTGKLVFQAETPMDVVMMHLNDPPPSLASVTGRTFPQSIEYVVGRCLEKRPEDRYQSVKELIGDLERIREGKEPLRQPTAPARPVNTSAGKDSSLLHFALIALLIASSIPVIGGLTYFLLTHEQKRMPTVAARQAEVVEASQDTGEAKAEAVATTDGNITDSGASELLNVLKIERPAQGGYHVSSHTTDGKEIIKFSFPTKTHIGYLSTKGMKPVHAVGNIEMPRGEGLTFRVGPGVKISDVLHGFADHDLVNAEIPTADVEDREILTELQRQKELKALDISRSEFDDNCLGELEKIKTLRNLNIERTAIGLKALGQSPLLDQLDVLTITPDSYFPDFLEILATKSHLKSLIVRECLLSDDFIKQIGKIKSLVYLQLNTCPLPGKLLEPLSKLKNIKTLCIFDCGMKPKHLAALEKIKKNMDLYLNVRLDQWPPDDRQKLRNFIAEDKLDFLSGTPPSPFVDSQDDN